MIELSLLIGGLTQVAKMTGLPAKYLPAFSVLVGGLIGYILIDKSVQGVMSGVLTGMATTGVINRIDHVAKKIGPSGQNEPSVESTSTKPTNQS